MAASGANLGDTVAPDEKAHRTSMQNPDPLREQARAGGPPATIEEHRAHRNRRLSANVLVGLFGKVSNSLIALASVPLLIRAIGVDGYGLYMTITAVSGWVAVGTLGLGKGLINAIVEANAKGDEALARRSLVSLWAGLAGLLAIMAVGFLVAFPLVPWGEVFPSASPVAETRWTVGITVCFTFLGLLASPVFIVFSAYQDERKATLFSIARNGCTFAAVAMAWLMGLGMVRYALATGLLVTALNLAAVAYLFGRDRPQLWPRPGDVSLPLLRSVLAPSLSFFLIDVAALLAFQIDKFLILQFSVPADVTQFDLASKLFLQAFSLQQIVLSPLWPALGEAIRRGDRHWARTVLARIAGISGGLLAALTVVACLAGSQIVALWTGRQDVSPPLTVFLALGVYFTIRVVTDSHTIALFSMGHQRDVLIAAVAHGVLSLVLGLVLGSRFGFAGIAWSNAISFMLTSAWWVPLRAWARLREAAA